MRVALAFLLLVVAGCKAELSGRPRSVDAGADSSSNRLDASNPDSTVDADPNACVTGRQVYLNFGGQVLTHQATSDATQNQVAWGGGGAGTQYNIPAYRGGDANAATTVANAIINGLKPYPTVHVTLSRPAAGPYVMIVFGGQPATIGVQGTYDFAVAHQDCTDATKSDVGIILDDVNNLQQAANFALGAIGFGMGMVGTNISTNCMVDWNTGTFTQPSTAACTFGNVAGATGQCGLGGNTQDQVAVLQKFCQ